MIPIFVGAALLQFLSYVAYNRWFHPFEVLITDQDPNEPRPIPLQVIETANDPTDDNILEPRQESAENNLNDVEEREVEMESMLSGN